MVNEIKEITQIGGTLASVVFFLLYLQKKDEINKKVYDEFNQTISNHLAHSNIVIEKNTKALTDITVALKELCWQIKNNFKTKKK